MPWAPAHSAADSKEESRAPSAPGGHPPVALSTEAGVAIDVVHALGPILAVVIPAVVLVLTAVVTCITWCTLTPGAQAGWWAVSQEPVGPRGCVCDRDPPGPVGLWKTPGNGDAPSPS